MLKYCISGIFANFYFQYQIHYSKYIDEDLFEIMTVLYNDEIVKASSCFAFCVLSSISSNTYEKGIILIV